MNVFGGALFVKATLGLFLQTLVHLASGGKLEDKVDSGLVVEIAEHPQDIRMTQVALDLNFSAELMFDLCLLQL